MKERLLLLMAVLVLAMSGCARHQLVRPTDIIPQAEGPVAPVPAAQEREEAPITIEEIPPVSEETVFEIVLAEDAEEVAPSTPKEREEVTTEAVEPQTRPPIIVKKEKEEAKEIPAPTDLLRPGEELCFGIKYLGARIGIGVLKIEGVVPVERQLGYHLISTARSTGIFALIYRTNERLESFMDSRDFFSLRFEQHSYGRKPSSRIITYDQREHLAYYEDRVITIPPNTQDPISAFYYIRLQPLRIGEEVILNVNTGKENHKIGAMVVGREKIRTPAGEFDCLAIEPYFKDRDDPEKRTLRIYLTNDSRKIPVLITSKLPFGQVVVILEEIRG